MTAPAASLDSLGVPQNLRERAKILWLLTASGGLWWLWAWGAWMAFNLVLLVLYPTVIAPLFNKFEPLQDQGLIDRVNALMARCGFTAKGFFVMDGSRRSRHSNAFFTGFGRFRKIVLFDTLIQQLTEPELESVLAHEIGHVQQKHGLQAIKKSHALSSADVRLASSESSRQVTERVYSLSSAQLFPSSSTRTK